MQSTVKITAPYGHARGSHVLIDGVEVKLLTGVDVSLAMDQPNTVRLHMIAHAQDIEIGAEVRIGGAVIPTAVEMALLTYLQVKYPEV